MVVWSGRTNVVSSERVHECAESIPKSKAPLWTPAVETSLGQRLNADPSAPWVLDLAGGPLGCGDGGGLKRDYLF